MASNRIATFEDFWPYYLREHGKPLTRAFHYGGSTLAILTLIAALSLRSPWLFLAVAAAGYAPAWISHSLIERNRPATFSHPLWSLIADFRMYGLWLMGKLGPELDEAGLPRRGGVF